jgi:hypothetical protein
MLKGAGRCGGEGREREGDVCVSLLLDAVYLQYAC